MDLRATIVVLRERLEILSFDKDKAVQQAVLLSSDEIQQLKDMASSLRSELENLRFEKDAAVQQHLSRIVNSPVHSEDYSPYLLIVVFHQKTTKLLAGQLYPYQKKEFPAVLSAQLLLPLNP